MKNAIPTLLCFAALVVLPSLAAQTDSSAEPEPKNLKERVEQLEGNIDQILQLLKAQQPQGGTSTPSATPEDTPAPSPQAEPAPQTASLKPGAILEMWLLRPDFNADSPPGRSIGGIIDQGEYFNLLNFDVESSLAANSTNRIGLRWSGLFQAKEKGIYVFTLDWNMQEKNFPAYGELRWRSIVRMDGQMLIDNAPVICREGYSGGKPIQFSDSTEVELEPGFYPITIFTFIAKDENLPTTNWDYSKMKLTMRVRGPSDMLPKALTSNDFFHKQ